MDHVRILVKEHAPPAESVLERGIRFSFAKSLLFHFF